MDRINLDAEADRIAEQRLRVAEAEARKKQLEIERAEQARLEQTHRYTGEIAFVVRELAVSGDLQKLKAIRDFVMNLTTEEAVQEPIEELNEETVVVQDDGIEDAPLDYDVVFGDSVFEDHNDVSDDINEEANEESSEPETVASASVAQRQKSTSMLDRLKSTAKRV